MIKKKKILIATGGTGGHVFPAYSLASHLVKNNYDVKLATDNRGFNFIKDYKDISTIRIFSSPLIKKNLLKFISSMTIIFFSIIRSLIFLLFNRPAVVLGMGGYSSFPMCIAAAILKIKFVIYENNLIIGKANKFLLPLARKIFVSYKETENIPKKYNYKIFEIGNILREEIINSKNQNAQYNNLDHIKVLVLGGSQAAKIFADKLPKVFVKLKNSKIPIKIYQQCQNDQNQQLSEFYKKVNLEHEIFNFTPKIIDYYVKSNLVITRAGASVLGELINIKIPFISIPLPTSADNHQFKNAIYYQKKKFGFLLNEHDIDNQLYDLIKSIFNNKNLIKQILEHQRQYSEKNVFNNIKTHIEKL